MAALETVPCRRSAAAQVLPERHRHRPGRSSGHDGSIAALRRRLNFQNRAGSQRLPSGTCPGPVCSGLANGIEGHNDFSPR
ncbi:hypothetical protein G6F68_020077 [Rhizopus microsporus]|nr:hypothetical protein G6F68_020077 [Rhizopus microsporus]